MPRRALRKRTRETYRVPTARSLSVPWTWDDIDEEGLASLLEHTRGGEAKRRVSEHEPSEGANEQGDCEPVPKEADDQVHSDGVFEPDLCSPQSGRMLGEGIVLSPPPPASSLAGVLDVCAWLSKALLDSINVNGDDEMRHFRLTLREELATLSQWLLEHQEAKSELDALDGEVARFEQQCKRLQQTNGRLSEKLRLRVSEADRLDKVGLMELSCMFFGKMLRACVQAAAEYHWLEQQLAHMGQWQKVIIRCSIVCLV
jgi:hypothetical protein